ncbi:MAG: PLD nuclease N-terminal domain-containing protein [Actinomycetota bacterium]|nr:PLD nuclease N-terminal domain-containing protein [Actinomycetota bacterium]
MLFVDGLLGFVLIGFLLFCLLDVITSHPSDVRNLPKIAWLLLVIVLNPLGGIAWLLAGRPQVASQPGGLPFKGNFSGVARPGPTAGSPEYERPRRALAPDDDPAFLADLRKNAAEHEQMLGSWEDDLRRREEELRRRDRGEDEPPA